VAGLTSSSVAVDGSLGSYPYCNTALLATVVPIMGPRPQGAMPNPRVIYTAILINPDAARAYLQILSPPIAGNVSGQASLNTPGAQTGVQVVLPPTSAPLVNGGTYILDTDFPRRAVSRVESVVVTITAGPTLQTDNSNLYTVSFTSTLVHATVGPFSIMGGMTLGTTLPAQSYGVGSGNTLPLLFGDMGQGFVLGFAIAATTTPGGLTAPGSAMVVNLGLA
jgi:hypothetical protein